MYPNLFHWRYEVVRSRQWVGGLGELWIDGMNGWRGGIVVLRRRRTDSVVGAGMDHLTTTVWLLEMGISGYYGGIASSGEMGGCDRGNLIEPYFGQVLLLTPLLCELNGYQGEIPVHGPYSRRHNKQTNSTQNTKYFL